MLAGWFMVESINFINAVNARDKLEIQPLRRAVRESESYPVAELGDILSGAVNAVNAAIQAPHALCAQSFLAGAALAVQGSANLRLHGDTKPLSNYFITIAGSGERKSATDGQALRPHRDWQKEAIKFHNEEAKDYAIKKAVHDKQKAKILNGGKKDTIDVGALNKLIEPVPPRLPVLVTEEPTFEGLYKQLQYGLPSIGVFSDEGGRLVGGHAMNADNRLKTMAGLSKLWDGVPIDRVRGGDGSSILYHRRCSMHLMIQPLAADGFINDDAAIDQGILSRMLMVKPESTKGTRLFKNVDYQNSTEVSRYNKQVTALINSWRWGKETGELDLSPIGLSSDAFKLWIDYHDHVERQHGQDGAYHPITGFASKAAEHTARLAGIIQLFSEPNAREISVGYIEKSITLMDFYLGETLRIKESTESKEMAEAEKLLAWLKAERLRHIYPAKVYRLAPNSIRSKDKALPILKLLEATGICHQLRQNNPLILTAKPGNRRGLLLLMPQTRCCDGRTYQIFR
jgi:Protein of unknown function (DUF3987)